METQMEKALRKAVIDSGRSNKELAQEAGITEASLSLFINMVRNLRLDTAGKLANVLGLELIQRK